MNAAESFFVEKWNDGKHRLHCRAVIDACLGMTKLTGLNSDVFVIAGWIHDIGKIDDDENHHIASLRFLDMFLGRNKNFEPLRSDIEDCIRNHRTDGVPMTMYGQIFKLADKVALFDKRWVRLKERSKS